jgi:hypothetical protein
MYVSVMYVYVGTCVNRICMYTAIFSCNKASAVLRTCVV